MSQNNYFTGQKSKRWPKYFDTEKNDLLNNTPCLFSFSAILYSLPKVSSQPVFANGQTQNSYIGVMVAKKVSLYEVTGSKISKMFNYCKVQL